MAAHVSNCRLSGFSIRRPAGSEAANGLYANGRHQCEVIIDIVKESSGPGGEWVRSLLTEEERASVTVVEWAEHDHQILTQGWSCDKEKNEFDLGLWRGDLSVDEQSGDLSGIVDCSVGESLRRYLRCDPAAPIGSAVFMARVMIDGCAYITNGSKGNAPGMSFITINPVRSSELSAEDLDLHIDFYAYNAPRPNRTDVHCYYYTPPGGIRIVKNLGFDVPLDSPGEGENFRSVLSFLAPLDSEMSNTIGTFVNKDEPDSTLHLHEINEGLAAPSPNPLVRFNERPTIMRAIRLKSSLTPENRDTKSLWRLLDNFGSEHRYSVTRTGNDGGIGMPNLPFFKLNGEVVRKSKLVHFEITSSSGSDATNELYANGRHQCKVVVTITVERRQADGTYLPDRLTSAERDSLTVTRYSANMNEPLPPGWSCDKEKNIYDTGLWRRRADEPTLNINSEDKPVSFTGQREVVERYMRLAPNIPIESVRFMASIKVGDVHYTTNYSEGDIAFNSYVTIFPERPYALSVSDLDGYVDIDAFHDVKCDIDVYYWTPPSGLKFLVNRGFDTSLTAPLEGLNFRTSYYRNDKKFYKGGVVVNKDLLNPVVSVEDVYRGHYNGSTEYVIFNLRPTIMRAVRLSTGSLSGGSHDNKSKWRLWDNYGCEHVFFLDSVDDGNVLKLMNG